MNDIQGNKISESREGTLSGKHIVLGITGGIAAYKSANLARLLIKRGAEVQVVITPNGKEFITPATLSALTGKPVISEFFTANTGEWHSHVDLGLWADLMIIAPATACTIGKMANGIADNMLITTYLSAKEQVMIAPAMDLDMWRHPSTSRNLKTLREDGVIVIEPEAGELASGLIGKGRMEEPEKIVAAVEDYFFSKNDFANKRIVVTAGPTYEKIDPVRFIGNYSSGKMGYAIAAEFQRRGADVTLVSGPVSLETPCGVNRIDVTSAKEMHEKTILSAKDADIVVLSAAVADYAPETVAENKIKRETTGDMTLRLVKNPDIAAELGKEKGERILVGFALETDHEEMNAHLKLERKNLDWIILNSLKNPMAGFMKDTNHIKMICKNGDTLEFPTKSKVALAKDIADVLSGYLK